MDFDHVCFGCFAEKEKDGVCPHCGFDDKAEQSVLALPPGTILNGKYMLGKVLGMGGFGITYLGYNLILNMTVAIKEYMPSSVAMRSTDRYNVTVTGSTDTDNYNHGISRFIYEANILAKLRNVPNIVSVMDCFQENNTAYFVMEYVDGMSLREYIKARGGKLSYDQTKDILLPVMKALSKVHELNLMHRDISPDNIYITSSGDSRLLDFGAARTSVDKEKSVSVILKHGYAPAEQYSAHGNQGPWTDVYAMAATFYRCITGILPPNSIERMTNDDLKLPSALGIHIPANAEAALNKALALRVEDRFPDIDEFIKQLTAPTASTTEVGTSIPNLSDENAEADNNSPEWFNYINKRLEKTALGNLVTKLLPSPLAYIIACVSLLILLIVLIISPVVFIVLLVLIIIAGLLCAVFNPSNDNS